MFMKKQVIGAYIDITIKKKFEEYCEKNHLRNAEVIEKIIREFLEGHK